MGIWVRFALALTIEKNSDAGLLIQHVLRSESAWMLNSSRVADLRLCFVLQHVIKANVTAEKMLLQEMVIPLQLRGRGFL